MQPYRFRQILLMRFWAAVAFTVAAGLVNPQSGLAEKVTYRLKWVINASVAGDVVADEHGFFAARGLDVAVKPGGPELDAIRELELRRAEFGVASADQVVRALSKGADVVVIAQLFQINPLQWMVRTDQMSISRLQDLKGQLLAVTFGGNDEAILRALLSKAGLTESDVTLYSKRYDDTPFLKQKIPFWPVYRNTQAVFLSAKLKAAGEPFAFFNPADYGIKFVANSVITSNRILTERPGLVKAFTVALLQGWRDAMTPSQTESVIATLRRLDKNTPADILRQQLAITRSLIQPLPHVPIGTIDRSAWQQTERIMLNQQLIPKPVEIERVLKPIPAY